MRVDFNDLISNYTTYIQYQKNILISFSFLESFSFSQFMKNFILLTSSYP